MVTGEDAIELVLKKLLEFEYELNNEGTEIDIQELRKIINERLEENQMTEISSQIINTAIDLFEGFKKNKKREV